ncbi:MAG: P-loop NTPase [Rhodobacterales bacterium]
MSKSIAITSGKGGAGKTSLAINLALRLNERHGKAIFLDADFGMANGHILLKSRPEMDITDVLIDGVPVRDVLHSGPKGLRLVAGRTGATELLNLDERRTETLIQAFNTLEDECDYLVVDTSAGAESNTMVCAAAADHFVVVLVGQATGFVDAYAMIKSGFKQHGVKNFSVVVNMAASEDEAKSLFETFQKTVLRFMAVRVDYCGYLPYSRAFHNAAINCEPVAIQASCQAERSALDNIADRILKSPVNRAMAQRYFQDAPQQNVISL